MSRVYSLVSRECVLKRKRIELKQAHLVTSCFEREKGTGENRRHKKMKCKLSGHLRIVQGCFGWGGLVILLCGADVCGAVQRLIRGSDVRLPV